MRISDWSSDVCSSDLNIARLDPDEVNRCEAFTRLVREGRSVEDIGLTFGLTGLQVKRTLAIGNLLPRIRGFYRAGKIDVVTLRHLTLATKAQQREWLGLVDCPEKQDRKSVATGKSVSGRVDPGGHRHVKKKKNTK